MLELSLAFITVFLSEFGDKSQLLVLTQGSRYRISHLLIGLIATILLLQAIAVSAGQLLAFVLHTTYWGIPGETYLTVGTAVLFGVFGLVALSKARAMGTGEDGEDEEEDSTGSLWAFLGLYFLAEMGDKTSITTFALGATHNPVLVWIGSSAGFILATVIAIFAAKLLQRYVSPRLLAYGGAIAFLLLALVQIVGLVLD